MSFALKSYMMIYWTHFMKMDSYIYAALLVVCQVWDAINDPVIGSIIDADKHQYKRIKFVFNLDKNTLAVMNKELEERRASV